MRVIGGKRCGRARRCAATCPTKGWITTAELTGRRETVGGDLWRGEVKRKHGIKEGHRRRGWIVDKLQKVTRGSGGQTCHDLSS